MLLPPAKVSHDRFYLERAARQKDARKNTIKTEG
jgi:hypothetical protein